MDRNNIDKEITANYDKMAEKILKENPGICPALVTVWSYTKLLKESLDELEAKYGHLMKKEL